MANKYPYIIIDNVVVSKDKAKVTWHTSEPSRSFFYTHTGTLTIGEEANPVATGGNNVKDTNYISQHETLIQNLASRTHYNYIIYAQNRRSETNTVIGNFDTI